ncbi:MAG: LamG-like jellyroll fold domain-containing protein [bacterium]
MNLRSGENTVKVVLVAIGFFVFAAGASATTLFRFNFDNAAAGPLADGAAYTLGAGELTTASATVAARAQGVGADGPAFADAGTVLAGPFQGGKAMVVQSGNKSEGLRVTLAQGIAPGDLTVEAIFCTSVDPVVGPSANTVGLQYVVNDEWPVGESHQFMMRILGGGGAGSGKLYYWTDRGDSNSEKVETIAVISANTWYHCALVLNYNESTPASSQVELFLNGVSQGTSVYNAAANSVCLGVNTGTVGRTFTIGYGNQLEANTLDHRGLDGAIDAVAISDAVLGPGTFVLPTSATSSVENWSLFE